MDKLTLKDVLSEQELKKVPKRISSKLILLLSIVELSNTYDALRYTFEHVNHKAVRDNDFEKAEGTIIELKHRCFD